MQKKLINNFGLFTTKEKVSLILNFWYSILCTNLMFCFWLNNVLGLSSWMVIAGVLSLMFGAISMNSKYWEVFTLKLNIYFHIILFFFFVFMTFRYYSNPGIIYNFWK